MIFLFTLMGFVYVFRKALPFSFSSFTCTSSGPIFLHLVDYHLELSLHQLKYLFSKFLLYIFLEV